MARARARHILVPTVEACESLIAKLADGEDFAALAGEYSQCPSGKSGGDLGEFGQGDMVKEFDEVVFRGELGKIHGPVRTQFGFHLIEVTSRTDD